MCDLENIAILRKQGQGKSVK